MTNSEPPIEELGFFHRLEVIILHAAQKMHSALKIISTKTVKLHQASHEKTPPM